MDRRKELLVRAYLVMLLFVVLTMVILFRVFKVSVIEGDKWREKASVNVQLREVDADRGDIFADDFSVMSTSLQFFEIRMDMTVASKELFSKNVDSLAYYLSSTFRSDLTKTQWKEKLTEARKKKNQYLLIAKGLDIEEKTEIMKFPIFRNGRFGGGVRSIRYAVRTRPFKEWAKRTIGEDRDNSQKIGLEGYYDEILKGPYSKRLMKKISSDQWVPVYDYGDYDIQRGDDIVTTINIPMQDATHHQLEEALVKSQARAGVAIVMEVKTGKIKAISNLRRNADGSYSEIYNDGIGTASEPGSTFKLATVLALLEDGKADIDDKVDIFSGKKKFYDRWMSDSEPHNRAEVTLKEAFELSSNVGIAYAAHKAYNNTEGRLQFVKRLNQFGLANKTEVEIEGEPLPYIKHPKKDEKIWYGTTIPWMAHGYELSETPLQMLNFYNAVANDGKLMKPMLVSELRSEGKVKKSFHPIQLKSKIASQANIDKVQKLLRGVVENGTGKSLESDIVAIAGKTGTTRVNYNTDDEFKKYNASFAGYFPAEKPEYSMIVVVYDPKGSFYGASVAGPVFKNIAETVININHEYGNKINELAAGSKQIMPGKHKGYNKDFQHIFNYVGLNYKEKTTDEWVSVDPFENRMLIENGGVDKEKIPDVRGMGARDAVFVLENLGLKVNMDGLGKVVTQNIKPGTPARGQKIDIKLN